MHIVSLLLHRAKAHESFFFSLLGNQFAKHKPVMEETERSMFMNTTTKQVLQEGVLQKYPLQVTPLLQRFSLTLPKGIADTYNIQEKILPVLTEANDIQLTVPTFYHMLESCRACLNDHLANYYPIVEADSMISCLKVMIDQIPLEEAATILPTFSTLIEEVRAEAKEYASTPYFKERAKFAVTCEEAFTSLSDYMYKEKDTIIGHSLAAGSSNPAVSVGNGYLNAFSANAVPDEEDLRKMVFADPFTASNVEAVMDIGKVVGEAIASMSDTSTPHSMLDGAEVALQGITEQVMQYLVEVRCGTANIQSMQEFCEKTNYDMECYLNQDTAEEDCLVNVTNCPFGWSDEDILLYGSKEDTGKMDDVLNQIFSQPNITGKNIQYAIGAISVIQEEDRRKEITESLKTAICQTMCWESSKESYQDLPINTFVLRSEQLLEHLTKHTVFESRLKPAFEAINQAMVTTYEETLVQQGVFNPAPSVLSLCPLPVGMRLTQQYFDDIYRAETDEEIEEAMIQFSQGMTEAVVTESNKISKGARSASRKIQQKTEKAIRTGGGTAHEVKQAVKNAIDPMERYVTQMMDKLKKADRAERREVILKGGTLPKVLRWVKRSIPIVAGAAIGAHGIPIAAVVSGIALIGFIASDINLDQRERRKIMRELEDELEVVKEKIDDSRGDENKQKKYELMRIRNELQRQMDRVKYNLKE